MKKTYLLLIMVCFVALVWSCKTTNNEVAPGSTSLTSLKVSRLLTLSTEVEQRLAYSTLDSNEKAAVWLAHVDRYIKSNIFTSEQNALLFEFKNIINKRHFDRPIKEKYVQTPLEQNWFDRAGKFFTQNQIKSVVASLNSPVIYTSTVHPSDDPGNGCSCANASDWCGGTAHCSSGYVCDVVSGCGTFFQYDCNGKCNPNIQ